MRTCLCTLTVTQYTEEGWIRQELNDLRGRVKEVVESEGFWKVYLCRRICVILFEKKVIDDGLQNGSWVTNHQETKPLKKTR